MIRRHLLSIIAITQHLKILSENTYLGKFFYCTAKQGNDQVFGTWSITSGSQYASINQNGKVSIVAGAQNQPITVQCTYNGVSTARSITVSYDNQLTIEGPATMEGATGNVICLYNSTAVTPAWSITSGGGLATINNLGEIAISSSGMITVQAAYNNYTATKNINVIYVSGTSSTTTVGEDGSVTNTTTTVTENQDGSTTSNSTSTTTNQDGSVSNTDSETTTNQDGSSTTTSTTNNQDGTSSQSQIDVNADGSSSSSVTNYDSSGDPTDTTNQEIDTSGNVETQDVVYENGEPIVSGYEVDTADNPDGYKNINSNSIDTEYYAFDLTHGFELDIHFKFNATQPSGQNENHHNIVTMKRAAPSPWYGFQIRQTGSNKYIILGTQFSTGSNVNTNITIPSDRIFHLHIVYNPTTTSADKFVCTDLINNTTIYTANKTFPDLEELRYLTLTLGCALDENGNPYRYSNIDVYSFYITRT